MAETDKYQQASEKPTLGWFCTYTPEEIIIAAGLNGRRILGKAGESTRADGYLHPNLCAYVRACFSSALEGDVDDLAGIIGVDSCDAMRCLFDVWRSNFSPGFSYILPLPHIHTAEAMEYFVSELSKLVGALDKHFGLSISDEDLCYGIETMNETRSLLLEMNRLRRTSFSVSGRQFYETLQEAMTRPKQDFNSSCRKKLEALDTSEQESELCSRIVLAGGVLDDPWMIDTIEEAGGRVVADDMCCGSRYFDGLVPTNEEPLTAIAKRYIFRAPCARMSDTEARTLRLLQIIEEAEAHGLIYYSVKFCDPHMLDWVAIRRELQSRGIPALRCETDYSVSASERMRTRIEAFLEMLK